MNIREWVAAMANAIPFWRNPRKPDAGWHRGARPKSRLASRRRPSRSAIALARKQERQNRRQGRLRAIARRSARQRRNRVRIAS